MSNSGISFIHGSMNSPPNDSAPCSLSLYSDGSIDLQIMEKPPPKLPYKKLPDGLILNTETGEVRESRKSSNRGENLSSIRYSATSLFKILIENLAGDGSELHVVLTFAIPVYDYRSLYPIIKNFIHFDVNLSLCKNEWKQHKH